MILNLIKKIMLFAFFITATTVIGQEDTKINDILTKKIEYNKTHRTGKGFKIQLYNGGESRAYNIKSNFEATYGIVAVIVPELPDWKVQVGNYKTRLEADRALLLFKEKFSGAIILETKIYL